MKKSFPILHLLLIGVVALGMLGIYLITPAQPSKPIVMELDINLGAEKLTTTLGTDINKAKKRYSEFNTLPNTSSNAPAQEETQRLNWQTVTVKSGDNLTSLFKEVGLTPQDVYKVTNATKKEKAFRRLIPEQTLDFVIVDGRVDMLRHNISQLEDDSLVRQADGSYKFHKQIKEPELRQEFVTGTIVNSLFVDGKKAGLSQKKLMEMATIFGWDIDFALDIRTGDKFAAIYEDEYLDDKKIGESNILVAQFINQGRVVNAIRHTDGNYYNEKGYSMRKAFLRSPVDFFRISSKYNLKRLHPTLKTVRPHRGVDYAAATGTPIKASGDGIVTWKGTKGGYGRTVIIQHAGIYTTLYAHMSSYNKRIKKGSRVKQGQIIGYIGMSGTATGPHLHYEFRANGVHRNPLTVKFPNTDPLSKTEMGTFAPHAERMLELLSSYVYEAH